MSDSRSRSLAWGDFGIALGAFLVAFCAFVVGYFAGKAHDAIREQWRFEKYCKTFELVTDSYGDLWRITACRRAIAGVDYPVGIPSDAKRSGSQ